MSRSEFKGQSHRDQTKFCLNFGVSGLQLQFGLTDDYEIMHKAWSGKAEVPSYFSRSSVKF